MAKSDHPDSTGSEHPDLTFRSARATTPPAPPSPDETDLFEIEAALSLESAPARREALIGWLGALASGAQACLRVADPGDPAALQLAAAAAQSAQRDGVHLTLTGPSGEPLRLGRPAPSQPVGGTT